MTSTLPVVKIDTHVPPLDEVQNVLNDGLKENFSNVEVSIVDCPDLRQEPFYLAAEGLCGNPRLVDIGGPPYLLPLVQRNKIFSFKQIAEHAELPSAFMIGAGAGPAHVVGVNSELMNNVRYENGKCINKAYISKVDTKTGGCILEKLAAKNTEEFCLMGNFLVSEGKPGKVVEVKASVRTGKDDFVASLRKTLKKFYGEKVVALGGVFLVEKGSAHLHIMPDFSDVPLKSEAEVNNWLKFYDMKPTLVCVGELVSHDPGLDLRDEHFHCFSTHGEGGHYHWDTTPEDIVYRGYFTIPELLYRIDKPPKP